MSAASKKAAPRRTPALEWAAASIGLLLTLLMLGAMGWRAWEGRGKAPPSIEVRAERIVAANPGWVVTFTAVNHSPATAANVEIEARAGDATATATLDYVPGKSRQSGGLFFTEDPRGSLELKATGYAEP